MMTTTTNKPGMGRAMTIFQPENLEQAMRMAEMLATSSIIPKQFVGKPGDILVALQMGSEVGLPPMQSLMGIAVINGKPSLYGNVALAVIQSHPAFVDMEETWDEKTKVATVTMHRRNRSPVTKNFGEADARQAGLLNKDTYKGYLRDMCTWRARHRCVSALFPDVAAGIAPMSEQEYAEREVDATAETSGPARPRSRGQTLRDRLHPKEPEPEVEVGSPVDRINQAIAQAATIADLEPIKGEIRGMPNGEDKKALKKAWLEREEAIKAAGAGVNTDAGEIEEDGPLTDLALALREAGDAEELAALWPGIERMEPSPLRQRAISMYEQREADLSAAESA